MRKDRDENNTRHKRSIN